METKEEGGERIQSGGNEARDMAAVTGVLFEGCQKANQAMAGLVGDFPEEAASIIVTLFRVLASLWPNQLQQWATVILQGLPVTSAPEEAKVRFMKDLNEYVWTLFLPQ